MLRPWEGTERVAFGAKWRSKDVERLTATARMPAMARRPGRTRLDVAMFACDVEWQRKQLLSATGGNGRSRGASEAVAAWGTVGKMMAV